MSAPSTPPEAASLWRLVWSAEFVGRMMQVLALLLIVRLGNLVPLPGLDPDRFGALLAARQTGMLGAQAASDALTRMSIFALGLRPFLPAWALLQVLGDSIEPADAAFYRRWLTAAMAAVQAMSVVHGLETSPSVVSAPGLVFWLSTVLSLTAGTMLLLWLGERITRIGLCDGIWLIVASEFIADLPRQGAHVAEIVRVQAVSHETLALLVAIVLGMVALIVLVETAVRPIPTRLRGTGEPAGDLCLRIDRATMAPAYIASTLLLLPLALASFLRDDRATTLMSVVGALGRRQPAELVLFSSLVVVLTFVVTAMNATPHKIVRRLEAGGIVLADIPPGEAVVHLDGILTRLTAVCAAYLVTISVVPDLLIQQGVPVYVGGTPLLIAVIVMLDILHRASSASLPRPTTAPGLSSASSAS